RQTTQGIGDVVGAAGLLAFDLGHGFGEGNLAPARQGLNCRLTDALKPSGSVHPTKGAGEDGGDPVLRVRNVAGVGRAGLPLGAGV
ncbi:MAG: hypothetical protein ACK559_36630, partial [bacterium]